MKPYRSCLKPVKAALAERLTLSTRELADIAGVTVHRAYVYAARWEARGLIERCGRVGGGWCRGVPVSLWRLPGKAPQGNGP